MPGLGPPRRNEQISNRWVYSNGFCSNHRGGDDDVSYHQLQKFWSELSPHARQKLLRIDKQMLFEQARKNMCCSRCNGMLLEGFMQIVMYGKSLQQEGGAGGQLTCNRPVATKDQINCGSWNMSDACRDEIPDPSVHPWGGLIATRDGLLTLLDCYLYAKSLKGLQNVFDSARGRERERELLYPDACGGGGRGWICQGMASYGRGHGTRETCALHTARLSCETLVDFWSALGEETRQSLLRMKEEDFIERLMYRFDSKRFCRDCRRNVIREFKELKELKRMKRELRCSNWFCVANAAFQYEVSDDTVQADWCETFADTIGTYHHFEWAVGTGEGKSDIVGFENVGMNRSVQVSGLDLDGLSACFITLRACKMDGRCTELSVKAHALKGQQCVHRRLVVGDGFVAITRGESIRRYFEHAEEVEEEEDDDSVDKDGNELDGECSRPQKHAKSPELAREFLLDAATVIFKEQVEKAFREGTARQNAHSIFVCLALKLLEERVHVACKEIITLEKQMKLLEEEENEKREDEERKERKRTKEREKKLRRKEKLKGKDKGKENPIPESNEILDLPDVPQDETSQNVDEDCTRAISSADSISETGSMPESLAIWDKKFLNGYVTSVIQKDSCHCPDGEVRGMKDGSDSFTSEELRVSHLKSKFHKDLQLKSSVKWSERGQFAGITESGAVANRSESRHGDDFETSRGSHVSNMQSRMNGRFKFNDKFYCSNKKMNKFHSCSCHQNSECRVKVASHVSAARVNRESTYIASLDLSKQFYRANRYSQMEYKRNGCGRPNSKSGSLNNSSGRDVLNSRKVWEPLSQRRYPCSNSDTDVMVELCLNDDGKDPDINSKSRGDSSSVKANIPSEVSHEDSSVVTDENSQSAGSMAAKEPCFSSEAVYDEVSSSAETCVSSGTSNLSLDSTPNSDNCSSCLGEGDCSPSSSNLGTLESSSISDSEDNSQQFEGREYSGCTQNGLPNDHEVDTEKTACTNREEAGGKLSEIPSDVLSVKLENSPIKTAHSSGSAFNFVNVVSEQVMFPPNQHLQFTMFPAPSTMGYYHQNPISWSTALANGYQGNHYLYASPFAYSFQGSPQFCLEYGPMQHLAAPLLNTSIPVYQPGPKLNPKGQVQTSIVEEAVTEANAKSMTLPGQFPAEVPLDGGVKTDNSAKLQAKSSNFSLFHFGGPVELSTCCQLDSLPSKDEISGVVSSKITKDQIENNPAFDKGTTAEEYNLFAASNGLRFSIF